MNFDLKFDFYMNFKDYNMHFNLLLTNKMRGNKRIVEKFEWFKKKWP